MSTLTGHSLLQALQERHRSSDSFTASLRQPPLEHLALHQLPQQVRAATGRVQLFPGSHEARAHGRGICLAAGAYAYAPQGRRGRASRRLPAKGKVCLRLPRFVVRAQAQVFMRLVRVDELARVHLAVRVPQAFELAEGLHEFGPEHLSQQRAARLPVPMLARERAAACASRDV